MLHKIFQLQKIDCGCKTKDSITLTEIIEGGNIIGKFIRKSFRKM